MIKLDKIEELEHRIWNIEVYLGINKEDEILPEGYSKVIDLSDINL